MLRTIFFIAFLFVTLCGVRSPAQTDSTRVLILVEGRTDIKSYAMGDGRHLATLMGHFRAVTTILGVEEYVTGMMRRYDQIFYIGFNARNKVPETFLADVLGADVPLVWLHTGFVEFSATHDVGRRFGFRVERIDSLGTYDRIESDDKVFTKEEPNINLIQITDTKRVHTLASAVSSRTGRKIPYIVSSGKFIYIADSPFSSIGPTDRCLLFADLLHDILHQQHEESHTAIIRIEDVNPMENPDKLRDIADILSSRGIPFLIGVTPFYVNPGEGVRIGLSDRPDVVDALTYMVQNGGSIVMHGVTHQYKGVTAADYEFWDESSSRPIKEESGGAFGRKIEMGIEEFMRNGLSPLAWETPHYTASFLLYETVAKYFSTAIEQRLAIEDFDYSQFFPYTINRDLFGQKIYPENLGYVPLDPDRTKSEAYIRGLIASAKVNLQVRDGFASNFFHAFVELDLLEELVDSIRALGYTYMDLREQTNWVRLKDRVLPSGSQPMSLTLHDQYLQESYFGQNGELVDRAVSDERLTGVVRRNIALQSGQTYKAEPTEFKDRTKSFSENLVITVGQFYDKLTSKKESWKEARPVILWNHFARGAAYNDQASFAAVVRSVNIALDTLFVGQQLDLSRYNLVIAPFGFIDSMRQQDFDVLVKYVENGGFLISDTKNFLVDELGFKFSSTHLNVSRPSDKLFPEERIVWRYAEPVAKLEVEDVDEIFCADDATEAPLVVGKKLGKGKIIYIGTRFDPYTQLGYSHYPFLLEYIRRYFNIGPIARRDNLEMYFDPGFRHTQSAEDLVKLWVTQGIRRIHVAGWHQYPTYTYDYERLIRLAHRNGILVYAWLEPPQVSQKFWLGHPEWREKNVKGEDVRPSWRYPVALTDSACRNAMTGLFTAFLEQYDWDGVNLAELYFEAGKGFDEPNLWSPMHVSAQKQVKDLFNIELASIFDARSPFYWKTNSRVRELLVRYRVRVLNDAYKQLLESFVRLRQGRDGFQIVVTAMDSHGSPELREYIGVDMDHIVQLQKEYGFLLQVEDPEHRWSTDPMRYLAIGKHYEALLGGNTNLLLDLNILSFRKPDQVTPFPTMIPTGTETFLLVKAASLGAPRATIYAESSVNPQDMMFLPYATATGMEFRHAGDGYVVSSPFSFMLKMPREVQEISMDGAHMTPARENLFLIPAGRHTIVISPDPAYELSGHQIEPRIMSFSGNIVSVSYNNRSVHLHYESEGRTLLSLNREPVTVSVDGREYPFTSMKGNDCFSIFLPPGEHSVEIVAGDLFAHGINLTSFWSSTGIALFGSVAVLLLLVMYVLWVIVRRQLSYTIK